MAARPSLPGPTSAAQLSRWADLPPELLRAALAGAEEWFEPPPGWDTQEQTSLEDTPLTLADLLHAASACRSWRHALSQSPPLGSLTVGARPAGQQAWMERVRPGVRCLRLHFSAAGPQGQALLRALRPEVRASLQGVPCWACLTLQRASLQLPLRVNLLRSLPLCSSLPSSFPLQATFGLEVAVPQAACPAHPAWRTFAPSMSAAWTGTRPGCAR